MRNPEIKPAFDTHRDQAVMSFDFEKDYTLISKVKTIKGTTWSQSRKFCAKACLVKRASLREHIPREEFNLNKVFEALKDVVWLNYSALKENAPVEFQETKKQKAAPKPQVSTPAEYINLLEQKRYAENTKAIYLPYFADFIRYFPGSDLTGISKEEINGYILELIREKNISSSQQNQRINAIKFYNIVKITAKLAGIERKITLHILRHSFATHLIEQGVSLRHIQLLLGHASPKTTEIYTHIANSSLAKIKSPLDYFMDSNDNNTNKIQK